MSNLKIREFEQSLINQINCADIPIEVKRIVVKDILNQLEEVTNKVLKEEIMNKESEEAKDGN